MFDAVSGSQHKLRASAWNCSFGLCKLLRVPFYGCCMGMYRLQRSHQVNWCHRENPFHSSLKSDAASVYFSITKIDTRLDITSKNKIYKTREFQLFVSNSVRPQSSNQYHFNNLLPINHQTRPSLFSNKTSTQNLTSLYRPYASEKLVQIEWIEFCN